MEEARKRKKKINHGSGAAGTVHVQVLYMSVNRRRKECCETNSVMYLVVANRCYCDSGKTSRLRRIQRGERLVILHTDMMICLNLLLSRRSRRMCEWDDYIVMSGLNKVRRKENGPLRCGTVRGNRRLEGEVARLASDFYTHQGDIGMASVPENGGYPTERGTLFAGGVYHHEGSEKV